MKRALPAIVLWLFPVVLLLLSGAAVASLFLLPDTGWTFAILRFVSIPILIAVVMAVVDVARFSPETANGHVVERDEQPHLWRMVEELAGAAKTAPPTRIVVTPDVNASVAEWGDTREMTIGLPLLATFTQAELRFVLGHELGHYAGGDTADTAKTTRRLALLEAVHARANILWSWFVWVWAWLYAAASGPLMREREMKADEIGVALAGGATGASALQKLIQLDMVGEYVMIELPGTASDVGRRGPLTIAFQGMLANPPEELSSMLQEAIADEPTSVLDSHPPIRERLAALGASGEPPASPPATDLLVGGKDWLIGIEPAVLPNDRPLADWEAILPESLVQQSAIDVRSAARVLKEQGHTPTVGLVLDMIDSPAGLDWIEGDAEDQAGVLTSLVAGGLLTQELASPRFDWTEGVHLVDGQGQVLPVGERVSEAVEGHASATLRAWLSGLGLDLERPLTAPAAGEAWLGSISLAKVADQRMDVHCWVSGILLLPTTKEQLKRAKEETDEELEIQRITDDLAAHGLDTLRTRPGARWIDRSSIATIDLKGRIGLKVDIGLVTGEQVQCSATLVSGFVPDHEEVARALFELSSGPG